MSEFKLMITNDNDSGRFFLLNLDDDEKTFSLWNGWYSAYSARGAIQFRVLLCGVGYFLFSSFSISNTWPWKMSRKFPQDSTWRCPSKEPGD